MINGKVIYNNESTKSIVHEKHEQDMLLFVFFVPFVESFFPADQIFDGMFSQKSPKVVGRNKVVRGRD